MTVPYYKLIMEPHRHIAIHIEIYVLPSIVYYVPMWFKKILLFYPDGHSKINYDIDFNNRIDSSRITGTCYLPACICK